MKRLLLFVFIAAIIIGCCQQELPNVAVASKGLDTSKVEIVSTSSDSVLYYFSQARLGIGDAYVKMARYYLDGTLGKPDILKVIQMGYMAEEYMAIPNLNALFKEVPDSDITKKAFLALDMLNHTEDEDSLMNKANELVVNNIPEGYLMQAIIAFKKGDNDKALTLFNKAVKCGSEMADVFRDIILSGTKYGDELQPATLLKIADRFPMAYSLLGDYYAKIPNDSAIDIPLAREYYLKASDYACLGRREAQWVLEIIYIKGYPAIDSLIEKRLWSLYRQEINDSVIWLD